MFKVMIDNFCDPVILLNQTQPRFINMKMMDLLKNFFKDNQVQNKKNFNLFRRLATTKNKKKQGYIIKRL
jgi:hypothetical protein